MLCETDTGDRRDNVSVITTLQSSWQRCLKALYAVENRRGQFWIHSTLCSSMCLPVYHITAAALALTPKEISYKASNDGPKTLPFSRGQSCSTSSINIHVYGKAKQIQASVDILAGLFSHYPVNNNQEDDGDSDE